MDQIFTPPTLAQTLLSHARLERPALIADFAVGDGALLKAAAQRWPTAQLLGTDIDPNALKLTRRNIRDALTSKCDFLDPEARRKNARLREIRGKAGLVLLNPPFNAREKKTFRAVFGEGEVSCSRALAFVLNALPYLTANGELLAILPANCLSSERDRNAMNMLAEQYVVKQLGSPRRQAFQGHSVAVVLVRLSRRKRARKRNDARPSARIREPYQVLVSRGSTAVHSALESATGMPYVHTTHLRDGRLITPLPSVAFTRDTRTFRNAVVLSRVGKPDARKVCILRRKQPFQASDCVIVLQTVPSGFELALQKAILKKWDSLSARYGGSCAPYLTLQTLVDFLRAECGVRAEPAKARASRTMKIK